MFEGNLSKLRSVRYDACAICLLPSVHVLNEFYLGVAVHLFLEGVVDKPLHVFVAEL